MNGKQSDLSAAFLKSGFQTGVARASRGRIARDLHDDLGTALTGLALELDVIRRETQGVPPTQERLGATAKRTRNLAERMREVVWAINPRCDNLLSLAIFLEQETAHFLRSDGLGGRFEFPEEIPALPLDSPARHQLALSVREALTNVVRHAHATEVVVSLAIQESPHGSSASNRADGPVTNPSGVEERLSSATIDQPTPDPSQEGNRSSAPDQASSHEGSRVGRFMGRMLVVEIRDNGRGFRLDEAGGHGLASVRERRGQRGRAIP